MPSRREFIQAGLAMSVTPVALPIRQSVGAVQSIAPHVSQSLYCIVCDTRSSWSSALAREVERLGIRVERTSGDITEFWFNDLSRCWKDRPVAIGGLTAHGPLFCLERLGWDHGLRVVLRGTHRVLDTGNVEHAISGPSPTITAARASLAGADWPSHVARMLTTCPVAGHTTAATVRSAQPDSRRADMHETLLSWVIAPRAAHRPVAAINVARS
jgi:hypothetical protein